MEDNNRRTAVYNKRSEAKQDCDDFNETYKAKDRIYEVREIKND